MSATDRQVGGEHYQTAIQPIQFILANGLGFCEGNVIKYVTRYKTKGTPLQDLEKAKHYLEFLIEQVQREHDSHNTVQAIAVHLFVSDSAQSGGCANCGYSKDSPVHTLARAEQ